MLLNTSQLYLLSVHVEGIHKFANLDPVLHFILKLFEAERQRA